MNQNDTCPQLSFQPTKIQKIAFELIIEFLNQPFEQCRKQHENHSPELFGKEYGTLQLQLPRGLGSTRLCLELSNIFKCLIVYPTLYMADRFREKYLDIWPQTKSVNIKDPVSVTNINIIKKETKLISPDLERLQMISKALQRSNIIVFDVFKAYADNSAVKKLYEELGYTHRFIIFR